VNKDYHFAQNLLNIRFLARFQADRQQVCNTKHGQKPGFN